MDAVLGPIPNWIVASAFLVGLLGVALVTWYATKEYYEKREAQRDNAELKTLVKELLDRVGEMKKESENYKRIKGNRLYRESFEDVSFAALSARLRLEAAQSEINIARELLDIGATK